MIRSMTAFARVQSSAKEGGWAVEIRSLNNRYFEFSLKLPPALSSLESEIRELIRAGMHRGKIMVAVSQDLANGKFQGVSIDGKAAAFYISQLRKLKKRFKLEGEILVSDLLKFPNIFAGEESQISPQKSWPSLRKALLRALEEAKRAKETEGRKLLKDIVLRLNKIEQAVTKIERETQAYPERLFERLKERVGVLLAESGKDPERVEREVAFLCERSDITEELVRMKSHLELFRKRLKRKDEIGRELDFLCQEMNREANTMGSKAQLFEVSTEVVFVKSELEKIREQIQNVE